MNNGVTVSEQAITQLKYLEAQLNRISNDIHKEVAMLRTVYEDNETGLGSHSSDILSIIESVESAENDANKPVLKLVLKLQRAAIIRTKHIEKNSYAAGKGNSDYKSEAAAILGRMYDELYRRRSVPHEENSQGQLIGEWKGNTFYPHDSTIPSKFNPDHLTFGTIKSKIAREFGLYFNGIPFINGYADFSSISVATISFADVIQLRIDKDQTDNPTAHRDGVDFEAILRERAKNFECADEIAADNQFSIPGLSSGYTKKDIKAWRENNHFTWDESYDNGYALVPSVIHGNIPHTGLVGVATHGSDVESIHKGKLYQHCEEENGNFVDEEDAIISIAELEKINPNKNASDTND